MGIFYPKCKIYAYKMANLRCKIITFWSEMANFCTKMANCDRKWPFWSKKWWFYDGKCRILIPRHQNWSFFIENDQFLLENARFVLIFVQLFLDHFFIMIIQYGRQWGGIEQCRTEYVLEHIRRFHQKRIFYTSYFPPNILSDSYSSTYFGQMMSTYCREHVIDTLDKIRGNQTEIRINQKP